MVSDFIFSKDFSMDIKRISFFAVFLIIVSVSGEQKPIWEDLPIEEVPPLNDELVEYVKNQPIAQAKIKANDRGSHQLFINGKQVPFVFGCTPLSDPQDQWHVGVYEEAGIRLIHVFANLSFYHPERFGSYHRPFWVSKDKYDPGMVKELLWRVLKVYPDARILLTLQIDAYPDWHKENPEELMQNEKGEYFLVTHHFSRTGKKADSEKKLVPAWSLFSDKFISDTSKAIDKFIQIVESSVPGRSVIGYMIGSGQDMQNYMWHPPDSVRRDDPNAWGDYSKPALKAWKKWVKDKYNCIHELNSEWNSDFCCFESVTPPDSDTLVGSEKFHNPQNEQKQIDWKTFLAEGRTDFILKLADAVRTSSGRDIIIGTYSGEAGVRSDVEDNYGLLQSDNIDFLCHQVTYGNRLPPSVGGVNAVLNTHQLNGKQFMADADFRTWLQKPVTQTLGKGVSINAKSVGRASSIAEFRSMFRREMGRLWAAGLGVHFHPLHAAHMYKDLEIIEELEFLEKTTENLSLSSAKKTKGDVAVIFDEDSIAYLKGGLQPIHWKWWTGQMQELNGSGVPYRVYYADDFKAGKVPRAKVYIFVNQLDMDDEIISEINKLKEEGTTFVFMQNTGFIQIRKGEIDKVSETIGMRLFGSAMLSSIDPGMADSHELLDLTGEIDPEKEGFISDMLSLAVYGRDVKVLSKYKDSRQAGLAVKEDENYKSIFAGTYVLSKELINAIARYAGAWVVTEPGYAVAAMDGLLMIHPLESDKVQIRLDKQASLESYPPFDIHSSKSLDHVLDLKAGKTYLFRLK